MAATVGVDSNKKDTSNINNPAYMNTTLTDVPMYFFVKKYNPIVGNPMLATNRELAGNAYIPKDTSNMTMHAKDNGNILFLSVIINFIRFVVLCL